MGVDPLTLGVGALYGGYKWNQNRRRGNRDRETLSGYEDTMRDQRGFRTGTATKVGSGVEPTRGLEDRLANVGQDPIYQQLMQRYQDQLNNGYQSRSLPYMQEFAETGGWSPDAIAGVNKSIAGYDEIAGGGGAANTLYKELMETGGWSDEDTTRFRQENAAQTPAVFDRLGEQLERRRTITGGQGGGVDREGAMLARGAAQENAGNVRRGNLELGESVRSGREAGASGYSRNVLSGLSGALGGRMGLQNSINQGRQFGAGGLEDISRSEADYGFENMRGMEGLRQSGINESMQYLGMIADSLGLEGRQRQDFINSQLGLNQQGDQRQDDLESDLLSFLGASRRRGGGRGSATRFTGGANNTTSAGG